MTERNHGFTKVHNEILRDNTISIQARMLYIILLSRAWTKNQVYPGQKLLAKEMGISDRSVRNYLAELVEIGLVSLQRRGLTKTNIYTLNKWVLSSHQQKNIPIKNEDNFLPQNGKGIPTNNTQNKKNESESGSPSVFSLSSEEKQALADRAEVTISAIDKVAEKYLLYCEDKNHKPSLAGLKKWILTEKWELDDYNLKKRSEVEIRMMMQGFMG